jgi:dTDP-4-dehydrorhamnose reductase
MLGTDLCAALRASGLRPTVLGLPEFDLTRPECLERALDGVAAVIHYAAGGYVSRCAVAEAILALRGITGKRLKPGRTADFPAPARRPLNSRFDCSKIDALPSAPRPHWLPALARFLAEG